MSAYHLLSRLHIGGGGGGGGPAQCCIQAFCPPFQANLAAYATAFGFQGHARTHALLLRSVSCTTDPQVEQPGPHRVQASRQHSVVAHSLHCLA